MAERFTKSIARNIYLGGSAFFVLLFLALTFDTQSRAMPERDNRDQLTASGRIARRGGDELDLDACLERAVEKSTRSCSTAACKASGTLPAWYWPTSPCPRKPTSTTSNGLLMSRRAACCCSAKPCRRAATRSPSSPSHPGAAAPATAQALPQPDPMTTHATATATAAT
jgi:hypothetical protein